MKAQIKASGEIIEVKEWRGASNAIYSTPDMNMFYADNELEILPDTTEQVTIEGYVARDKDGGLYLYYANPYKGVLEWHSPHGIPYRLNMDSFPEVTWQSEPKRVRITITPMEE